MNYSHGFPFLYSSITHTTFLKIDPRISNQNSNLSTFCVHIGNLRLFFLPIIDLLQPNIFQQYQHRTSLPKIRMHVTSQAFAKQLPYAGTKSCNIIHHNYKPLSSRCLMSDSWRAAKGASYRYIFCR